MRPVRWFDLGAGVLACRARRDRRERRQALLLRRTEWCTGWFQRGNNHVLAKPIGVLYGRATGRAFPHRVPHPRSARGPCRGPRGDAGRGQAEGAVGGAPAPRQRDAQRRPADRRALGRAPPPTAAKTVQVYISRLRRRLEPWEARPRRDPRARLRARARSRAARRSPVRAPGGGGPERACRGPAGARCVDARDGAGTVARAAAGGSGLRAVRAARDRAAGRAARRRARGSDEAELALGRHAELVGRLEGLVAEHPSASDCGLSSCSRCTAAAGRPTRCRPTATRAARWAGARASSRASGCASSSARSSRRIRGSISPGEAAPAPGRRCGHLRRPRA